MDIHTGNHTGSLSSTLQLSYFLEKYATVQGLLGKNRTDKQRGTKLTNQEPLHTCYLEIRNPCYNLNVAIHRSYSLNHFDLNESTFWWNTKSTFFSHLLHDPRVLVSSPLL